MKLKDKVAVITGGNSGMGRAMAKTFQDEGAKVVVLGRNAKTLEETAKELGDGALTVQGDVGKLADLDDLFAKVKAKFGRVDVLAVNAGIAEFGPIDKVDEATFDKSCGINFKGAYFTIQKALPLMSKGGSIFLTSSNVHSKGFPGTSVYSATKAAVRNLARTLAAELAPKGIRVNTLSPGPIDTPIFYRMGMPKEEADKMKEGFGAQTPLGRVGSPEEMAKAALFLASEDSSYTTASDLVADGVLSQV